MRVDPGRPCTHGSHPSSKNETATSIVSVTVSLRPRPASATIVVAVISESASGINEKRRGLHRLLKMAKNGKIDIVLVEFQDRQAHFGSRYIDEYLSALGVQSSSLDETSSNASEEELTKDLVTIVTLFSTRLYGRPKHGFRKKVTDGIEAHHAQSEGGDATSG